MENLSYSNDQPEQEEEEEEEEEEERPHGDWGEGLGTDTSNGKLGGSTPSATPSVQEACPMSPQRVTRNVWLISTVFMLLFTAYGGLSQLQSSLHIVEGMGVITQSILYGTMTISCLLTPKLVINKLGHKWTLAVSMIGYILWIAANGYAVWATMIPACILVGLCAPLLWTSQCAYFTIAGTQYAKMTGENKDAVLGRFFGIFFMMFQIHKVIGSLISSVVLNQRPENYTSPSSEDVEQYCGANDCPGNNFTNTNYEKQDPTLVWTLVGIYSAIGLLTLAIHCIFVDQLPTEWIKKPQGSGVKEVAKSVGATVRLMRHWRLWVLVPLTVYSGLEQTFTGADYNKAFITCAIGIWMVGFVAIPGGVVNAATSYSCGRILKYTGRVPIFTVALVLDLAMLLTVLMWMPDPAQLGLFFMMPIFWGVTDGIWQAQINTLYGTIFPEDSEAAFSNYRLWESLGFTVAFAWSNFFCCDTKIYINLSFLALGMTLYYVMEIRMKQEQDKLPDLQMENSNDKKGKELAKGEIIPPVYTIGNHEYDNKQIQDGKPEKSERM